MGEMRGAAKTQYLYARALERVTPSYHPGARVTVPRLQQPIMDDGRTRTQLLDPKRCLWSSIGQEEAEAAGAEAGRFPEGTYRAAKLAAGLLEDGVLREA